MSFLIYTELFFAMKALSLSVLSNGRQYYDSTLSSIRRCCDIAAISPSKLWMGELIQCDGGFGSTLGGGGLLNFGPAYGITDASVLFSLRRRRGMFTEVASPESKATEVDS